MTRSRAVLAAPIVLAIVLIGALAIRARNADDGALRTTPDSVCAPIARADAIATKPGEAIAIDVLANDSDPDGDPLIFEILSTIGGESTVDDGGTVTDASDDRVLFTPDASAPALASIAYQAIDPQGLVDEADVSISVNDQGSLPEGVHSESVNDIPEGSDRCGTNTASAPTTSGAETLSSSPPYTGSVTVTTIKSSKSSKLASKQPSSGSTSRTTTTRRSSSSTTRAPGTTQPPRSTTTNAPNPNPTTTTTRPSSPPPTSPSGCGSPDPGSPNYNPNFKDCIKGNSSPTTTTTP